jgi:hypothetical protein
MVSIIEHSLRWMDSYVVSYSGTVRSSYLDSGVQQFLTFQLVPSTKVCVKILKSGKVGPWTGVLVVKNGGGGEELKIRKDVKKEEMQIYY